MQHHDVDVLDAQVQRPVPERHLFEHAAAQLDGVFRGQSHRVARLLAEYGVGMPVAVGEGRERLLGEVVALAEGHEVGVLLPHPGCEVVEILLFVELHAFENIVADEPQGFGFCARSGVGRDLLVRNGGIVLAARQQGGGSQQQTSEHQPAQVVCHVVCFHIVRGFICCNGVRHRRR